MKFGQLIEYNMRNIFLEKSYTKCGEETIHSHFLIVQHWAYLRINSLKFYTVLYSQAEDCRNILKISCRPLAFTSYKASLKNENRSGTSFPGSFSTWFLKKNISLVIFYYLTKFHCLVAFTSWDIGQYGYCNGLLTRLCRHKFWN